MSGIRYPGLENLPRLPEDVTTLLVLREAGHVTLVFQRSNGERVGVFTVHRAEANMLAERLKQRIDGQDGETTIVAGIHIGGPPTQDQLLRPNR